MIYRIQLQKLSQEPSPLCDNRPTHFPAVQSAVKRVQLSSTNCSKTVHLSKAAVLELFINTTGRHLVLPPAREVSNTPLVIYRDAEVK